MRDSFTKILGCALILIGCASVFAAESSLHSHALVIIPDFEGSALIDPSLSREMPYSVWGDPDSLLKREKFLGLRLPNFLQSQTLNSDSPFAGWKGFVEGLSRRQSRVPRFFPYQQNRDLYVLHYDWRREIASDLVPALEKSLQEVAAQHAIMTGQTKTPTQFVIVAHGFGGLVIRTLLSRNPRFASQISQLYLVGVPNLGTHVALQRLLSGEGFSAKESPGGMFEEKTISRQTVRMASITWPSLYEMLPFEDLHWEQTDAQGRSTRISPDDLLKTGVWQNQWPSAPAERSEYLDPWLSRFMDGQREPKERTAWEYCQESGGVALQNILAQVRDWRLQIGTLSYTGQLLASTGGGDRLKVIVGRGIQTPVGLSVQGEGTRARLLYAPNVDGDGIVTVESALEDVRNPNQIFTIISTRHERMLSERRFIDWMVEELARLNGRDAAP